MFVFARLAVSSDCQPLPDGENKLDGGAPLPFTLTNSARWHQQDEVLPVVNDLPPLLYPLSV